MHFFSDLFGKVLYMFWAGSQEYLNTVYTAIVICHASSVGCLLADANRTSMTNTYCVNTVLRYS